MNRRSFLQATDLAPVTAALSLKRTDAFAGTVGDLEIRKVLADGSLGPNLISSDFTAAEWTIGKGWCQCASVIGA